MSRSSVDEERPRAPSPPKEEEKKPIQSRDEMVRQSRSKGFEPETGSVEAHNRKRGKTEKPRQRD